MTVGDAVSISANPLSGDGKTMPDVVSWRSSDEAVATVLNGQITAVGTGTCTITAYVGMVESTRIVTVSSASSGQPEGGDDNGSLTASYEYVDLGLSVMWVTCNVGADKPDASGNYYAWGETGIKTDYEWYNYQHSNGSSSSINKYNTDTQYGVVDSLIILDANDDVAHVALGGNWRMPTYEEMYELCDTDNCDWTWTTLNDVSGYKVTSKKPGYEGHSIFIPAVGGYEGTTMWWVDSVGNYWCSSVNVDSSDSAWNLHFYSGSYDTKSDGRRCNGHPVRPVLPKDSIPKVCP